MVENPFYTVKWAGGETVLYSAGHHPGRHSGRGPVVPALARLWRTARADLLMLALLVLPPALFFWPILTPKTLDRQWISNSDLSDLFYPQRHLVAEEWRAGRLPLWNPYSNAGEPLLAQIEPAALYPLSALLLLEGGEVSYDAVQRLLVLHYVVAAWGAYFLARAVVGGRGPALFAGAIFACSGFLTGYVPKHLPMASVVAWYPWTFWALHHLAERGTWRWAALAGSFLALATLAGFPQLLVYLGYAVAAFVVVEWLRFAGRAGPGPAARHWLPLAALAVLVWFGFSAPQLVATLELKLRSPRDVVSYAFTSRGYGLFEIVDLVAPGVFRGWALYAGVLPLMLAAVGLLADPRPRLRFFAGLGLGALALSFGGGTMAYLIAYLALPGFDLFQQQERIVGLLALALTILAAAGLRSLLGGEGGEAARSVARWTLRLSPLPALGALGLLLLAADRFARGENADPWLIRLEALLWLTLMAIAGVVLFHAAAGRALRGRLLLAVAAGLALFDLISVQQPHVFRANPPATARPPSPIAAYLAAHADEGRVDSCTGCLPGEGLLLRLRSVEGRAAFKLTTYRQLRLLPDQERVNTLLGVRFVVTRDQAPPGARELMRADDVALYEREEVRPRLTLARRAIVATDDEAAAAALLAANFDPLQDAVVSGGSAPGGASGAVELLESTSERLVARVHTSATALLVVNEAWYPGWQATVDGVPTPVYRANLAMRAVEVPTGTHLVELRYQPGWLLPTLVLPPAVMAVITGALVWQRPRRHAATRPPALAGRASTSGRGS